MSDGGDDGSDDGVGFVEGEQLQLVRSAQLDWIHALAERLTEVGIPRQVNPLSERRATDSQWGLFVRPADFARAMEIDRQVLLEVMPDIPEDFDPTTHDTSQCPACGEPAPEGASECPGCGLALL